MAYQGSTASSSLVNVPYAMGQGITGGRTWRYDSTHISSDIEEPNFFTDGLELGMKPGDMLVHNSGSTTRLSSTMASSGIMTLHQVIVVGATITRISTGTTLAVGTTA